MAYRGNNVVTHPYENDHTKYSNNFESTDRNLYSTTSQPLAPLVTPLATREWNQLGIQPYTDTTTPASTTSLNSPHFTRPSSFGSSVEIPRSYNTTPLSSTSSEVPRTTLPSQSRAREESKAEYPWIIHEDPTVAKSKADKSMRSCMLCFTKNRTCARSYDSSRCIYCLSNANYCKGAITTPKLIDLDKFHAAATALLATRWQPQHYTPAHFGPLNVVLSLKPLPDSTTEPNEPSFEIRIPELSGDFRVKWGSAKVDNVLDILVAAEAAQSPNSSPLYDLKLYKHLCRRFCHCLSILRSLGRCTLDHKYLDHPRAVHTVLAFLFQLSRNASTIFDQIFDEIRGCSNAKRDKSETGTALLMYKITDHLGEIYKEISCLNYTLQQWTATDHPLATFFFDAPQTLTDLESLARGLRVTPFNFAKRSEPLDLGGIHLTVPFPPGFASKPDFTSLENRASFLEILAPPVTPHYLHNSDVASTAPANAGYNSGLVDSTCRNGQGTYIQPISPTHTTFGQEESQSVTDHYNAVVSDDGISAEVSNLRAQAHSSLDPDWTLGRFPDISTTTSDVIMPDCLDSGQWLEQDLSHSLGDLFSSNADTQPITFPTFPAVITSPQDNTLGRFTDRSYPTSRFKTFETQPEQSPSHIPISKKPSKRKRISSIFSRKKQHFDPGQTSQDKTTETLDPQFTTQHTPATLVGATSRPVQTERLSNGPTSRMSKPDWSLNDWENRHAARSREGHLDEAAGIAGDVQVANSERRPLSYPPRQAFRKSLDISVAVLTKRFERLRGDCAVSSSS